MVTAVTEPPSLSLRRRASSMAYSSHSFISKTRPSVFIPLPDSSRERSTSSVSGVCLTQTTIFTPTPKGVYILSI